MDVGGELVGELDPLITFFQQHRVPADLGENMSGWSIVAMPPGYRERSSVWHEEPGIRLRLLDPVDFIIIRGQTRIKKMMLNFFNRLGY